MKFSSLLTALLATTITLSSGQALMAAESAASENLQKALIYEKRGQYALSDKEYLKAIKAAPHEYSPYVERARYYLRRNQLDKALADYNSAAKLSSNDRDVLLARIPLLRRMGKFDQALADANRIIQLDSSKTDGFLQRGETYYQLKQYDKAIADATKLINAHSDFGAARLLRAESLIAQKDVDKAIPDLDAAISAEPKMQAAYVIRYKIRIDRNDPAGAREDLNRLLLLNTDNLGIYKERLKLDQQMKDEGGIISDLAKITALDPKNTEYGWQYAQLVWDKQPNYALKELNFLIGAKSENADYYALRALTNNEIEKYDLGMKDATAALAIDPKSSRALRARGEANLREHEYEKALTDFDAAITGDETPYLLYLRAEALNGLHKNSQAIEAYEQFIAKMAPNTAMTKEEARHVDHAKNAIARLKEPSN